MKKIIFLFLLGITTTCYAQNEISSSDAIIIDSLNVKVFDNSCLPVVASKRMLKHKFNESAQIHRFGSKNKKYSRSYRVYYNFKNSHVSYIKTDSVFILSQVILLDSTQKLCLNDFSLDYKTKMQDVVDRFPNSAAVMYDFPIDFIVSLSLLGLDESKSYVAKCLQIKTNINMFMRLFFYRDKLFAIELVEI